jgi:cytochrome P450
MTMSSFDHAELQHDELFEFGSRFLEELPITWTESHGGYWVVTRHADIVAMLKDHRRFLSSGGVTIPPMGQPVPVLPTESDEPSHRYYREALQPLLTPGAVASNETAIRDIVSNAIDAVIESGEADMISDIAQPVPVLAMAQTMGFDAADAQYVFETFSALVEAGTRHDLEAQGAAVTGYITWLHQKLDERRADPRNDLPSAVLAVRRDGRPLSDEECVGILWAGAAGAVETTAHAIGHALDLLDAHRGVRDRLRADPALIPNAVEEVLRLNSPTFMMKRTVSEDTFFGGVDMKAGQQVLVCFGWANYDASVFDDPDAFRLDRSPNHHLSFGYGIHKCVGMHLARQELRIVLEEVLQRMPDYERTSETLPRLRAGIMWGFDSVPVRFTLGPRRR